MKNDSICQSNLMYVWPVYCWSRSIRWVGSINSPQKRRYVFKTGDNLSEPPTDLSLIPTMTPIIKTFFNPNAFPQSFLSTIHNHIIIRHFHSAPFSPLLTPLKLAASTPVLQTHFCGDSRFSFMNKYRVLVARQDYLSFN